MVREIVKDPIFLARASAPATQDDEQTIYDLVDTLWANRDRCVGMAANMIGVSRQIIVAYDGDALLILLNPEIVKCSGQYETEEGCLSLPGVRKTLRWNKIKVKYQTFESRIRYCTFTGRTAQIIQHEIDHCRGILI